MIPLLLLATMLVQTAEPQANARYTPVSGVVTGRVLNLNGSPNAGERVAAMTGKDTNGPAREFALASITRADSEGRYRLEGIPQGRYYIIAGATDIPTFYPGVSVASTATMVNVVAGSTTSDIDFRMSPHSGVRVAGHLIFPPEQPATTNETVRLMGSQTPALQTTIKTDGTFEFARVRPGAYTLEVNGGNPSVMSPLAFDVPDRDLTGLDIRIPLAVPIQGKTVVEGSRIAAGRLVSLSFTGNVFSTTIDLPANAPFSTVLATGDYKVVANVSLPSYEIKSIVSGTTDLSLATGRLKVDRTSPPAIVVTLRVLDPVRVSGRIEDSKGTPVLPERLSLDASGGGTTLATEVRRDGSFEFTGVTQGAYSLQVQASPAAARFTIQVGKEDLKDVRLIVPAVRQIRIRAEVEGGGQVPPFLLRYGGTVATGGPREGVTRSGTIFQSPPLTVLGEYVRVQPSPDGTAVISLQEGSYRMGAEMEVTAAVRTPPYSLKSILSAGADLRQTPLNVGADGDLEVLIVFQASNPNATPGR